MRTSPGAAGAVPRSATGASPGSTPGAAPGTAQGVVPGAAAGAAPGVAVVAAHRLEDPKPTSVIQNLKILRLSSELNDFVKIIDVAAC